MSATPAGMFFTHQGRSPAPGTLKGIEMQRLLKEAWWVTKLVICLLAMAYLTLTKAKADETPRAGQFFVNVFAGMMVFDSTVTVGGIKLIDQGGDASQGGIRAGWINGGAFHLGVEVEGLLASGRSRAYIPAGNATGGVTDIYSRDVSGGYGIYGRIGWRTRGNSIMFLRPGIQYLNTSAGWDTAPAIGVSAEVPIEQDWAMRLDATYAKGDIEYYNGTIGIVFRF
jgi:hypothetical protein